MSFDNAAKLLTEEFPDAQFKFGMDDASHLYMAPESAPFPDHIDPYEDGISAAELPEYRDIESITSAISVWQEDSNKNGSKVLSENDRAEAFNQVLKNKGGDADVSSDPPPPPPPDAEQLPPPPPPPPETAELPPPPEPEAEGGTALTMEELANEIARLRAENADMQKENGKLQERLSDAAADKGEGDQEDDLTYLADQIKRLQKDNLELEAALIQARTELEQWRASAGQVSENR